MKKTLFGILALYCATSFGQQSLALQTIRSKADKPTFSKSYYNKSSNTKIWGAGANDGDADGKFSNNFTQATSFTPGDNVNSWTALSVNQNGGTTTPGSAYWTRSLTGYSAGAYWNGTTPIASPSQPDGVAIFDSDFLDNGGTPGAFGTGTSPSAHRGELISPRIDLTGYTDTAITANFYSLYRNFQINELSVSLSADDGTTWTTVDYRSLQANTTEGEVSVLFPNFTAGVANLTQVRIRFTFDGDYYFAIVDDIVLTTAVEYDLGLGFFDSDNNLLSETGEQVHLSNNRYFPISQVGVHNFQMYGANISNNGYQDVYPSDSTLLKVMVQKEIGGNWSTVFQDSTYIYDTIAGTNIIPIYDTIDDYSWVTLGNYRTLYTVSGITDNNSGNDTLLHEFSITEGYASKVDLNINNAPFASRSIAPAGTAYSSIEWGSVFNFPTAGSTGMTIDSVSLTYYVPSAFVGASNQTYFVNIYEFVDSNSDNILNDDADLTQIGIAPIQLTNLTNNVGTYQTVTVSGFVNASTGGAMAALTDGKQYYISVLINPSLTGGAATFDPTTDVIQFGASETKNYSMNGLNTPPSQPTPLKLTDNTGTASWFWTGYGMGIAPSIGLNLSSCTEVTSSQTISSCDSSVLINGNYYTSNQTIIDTLATVIGCDSIVTTYLTINTINTTVATSGINLSANTSGATYQWLDCSNNSQINGATNQQFVPSTNGDYAVEITQNSCIDTSSCITINSVGMNELNSQILNIYPNPTEGDITIELKDIKTAFSVNIYNVNGQIIYNKTNITSLTHQINLNTVPGIYFIEVINKNKIERYKIEKK